MLLSSSIAAQRSASIDLGFADPMYSVNWNDHSDQSLCSPRNVGALPIVRVSTSGAVTFGTAATCCRVSIKARSDQLASELPSSLRLELCFVIGSTSDIAPLPRLRIFLLGYQLLVHSTMHAYHRRATTVCQCHHHQMSRRSRMLAGVGNEICFHTMTPREESGSKQG